jgi:hypothetical protein
VLYVAGEILIWMLLALALGIGIGWLVWGMRSREDDARAQRAADELRQENQDLHAMHTRDAAMIAHLQQSAGGDTAPLVARIGELEGSAREAELLRARLFQLEQSETELTALRQDNEALRGAFAELSQVFGGQLDLGDPAAVRVRWSALQARAAESEHLAAQLDGLRAVLGGELDPAELQERFTELERRAGEADALRARLSQLEGGGPVA